MWMPKWLPPDLKVSAVKLASQVTDMFVSGLRVRA